MLSRSGEFVVRWLVPDSASAAPWGARAWLRSHRLQRFLSGIEGRRTICAVRIWYCTTQVFLSVVDGRGNKSYETVPVPREANLSQGGAGYMPTRTTAGPLHDNDQARLGCVGSTISG